MSVKTKTQQDIDDEGRAAKMPTMPARLNIDLQHQADYYRQRELGVVGQTERDMGQVQQVRVTDAEDYRNFQQPMNQRAAQQLYNVTGEMVQKERVKR